MYLPVRAALPRRDMRAQTHIHTYWYTYTYINTYVKTQIDLKISGFYTCPTWLTSQRGGCRNFPLGRPATMVNVFTPVRPGQPVDAVAAKNSHRADQPPQ